MFQTTCKNVSATFEPQQLYFDAFHFIDFAQRKRLFSLYSKGCLLDEEGWYSVTPEKIADQIADRCRCDTIIDAFCGVGGNTIAFAKTCERGTSNLNMSQHLLTYSHTSNAVIAIDNSPIRIALARHNAKIYGVSDRIEFILGDFLSFVRSQSASPPTSARRIDVVFLSPPWGGPSYIESPKKGEPLDKHHEYTLQSVLPVPGDELFAMARQLTPNVAFFLPRNADPREIGALVQGEQTEKVEIEENWVGDKLKTLTCYFGGLAAGQESLWDAPATNL
jgi:trimethylguanosine synthase